MLFRLVEQLTSATTPVEAARLIAEASDALFEWDAFSLTHYSPERDVMELVFGLDLLDGIRTEVSVEDYDPRPSPLARQVIAEGAKLILRGSGESETVAGRPFGNKSRRSESLMFVPIRRGIRVLGILSVQSYQRDAYTPGDLELLQAVADLCGGATERIRAERALRESEARLAQALAIANLGTYERNLLTGEIFCSDELFRLWHRDPKLGPPTLEELINSIIHPEDRAEMRDRIEGIARTGEPYETHYRILRPDGTVREMATRARAERDAQGRITRVTGTVQDITERRQAEESWRLFRALADGANDAIEVIDPETGRFLDMNERGCSDLGYTRAEILTMTVPDIDPQVSLPVFQENVARFRASGSSRLESVHRRKDGTLFPVEITVKLVRLDREYLVTVARDITERKQSIEALQASDDRYRLLADNSDDFVSLTDTQGRRLYISPSYYRATGWTPEDLERSDWRTRVHPDDVRRIEEANAAAECGQATIIEHRVRCSNGSWLWMERHWKPLRGADGRVQSFLGSARDITARKQTEEQIRRLNESLEQRVAERTAELEKANAALRESESQLRLSLDASNAGSWSWDVATNTAWWDARHHQLYGFEPHEPVSQEAWLARVHPADRKSLGNAIQTLLELHGSNLWNQEFRVNHPAKGLRWMAGMGRVERGENGRAVRFAGISLDITQRKTAEEKLRESEERFRAIFEQAAVGVGLVETATGRFVRVNQRYCDILGMTSDQVVATTFMALTHPEDLPASLHDIEQLKRGVIPNFSLEKRKVRPDGSTVWVNLTVSPMWLPGATPNFHIAVVEDISQRRQAEDEIRKFHQTLEWRVRERTAQLEGANAALRDSEARLAQAQSLAKTGSYDLNLLTGELHWSEEVYRLWRRDQALGPPTVDEIVTAIHPDDRERVRAAMHRAHEFGESYREEYRVILADGAQRHFASTAKVTKDDQGRVVRFTGALQDITERRQSEEALRLHNAVIEQMNDALLLCDLDGIIRDCNPAAEKMFGYTRSDLVGKTPAILHLPGEAAVLTPAIIDAVKANSIWQGEIHFVRKDGSKGICETVSVPLLGPDGNIAAVFGINRDITERRRLEREIIEISDLERNRIGQDLHDGLCQQLVGVAYTSNQLARELARQSSSAAAAAVEIADLLDDSISQARQIARGLYPASLQNDSLAAALRDLAAQVARRSAIACDVEADENIVIADLPTATHLFRIAQEAASNAVKHAAARRIAIRLSAAENTIRLSVSDDGVGLPAPENRKPGLGLHILNYRAAAIGGRLEIHTTVNQGTTVTCFAPIATPP